MYVPVNSGNIGTEMISWTNTMYPETEGYDDIIMSNPDFIKNYRLLNQYYNGGEGVTLPAGQTVESLVNTWAGPVLAKIRFEKANEEQ
jgi:hypothetical protein